MEISSEFPASLRVMLSLYKDMLDMGGVSLLHQLSQVPRCGLSPFHLNGELGESIIATEIAKGGMRDEDRFLWGKREAGAAVSV
jgi:hypothetical protein